MDPIDSHMRMFSGEGPNALPVLRLESNDLPSRDSGVIDVKVLDLVSHQLRYDANENGFCGFLPPSILSEYVRQNENLPHEHKVPIDKEGINLHHLSSSHHYVTSHKKIIDGQSKILVYDSLPPGPYVWKNRLKDLTQQLSLLYGPIEEVHVICSQSQGRLTNNCGVYAIANAMMILHRRDPCWYQLLPGMRKNLIDMLKNGTPQLRLFPAELRQQPINLNTSDLNSKKRMKRENPEYRQKENENKRKSRMDFNDNVDFPSLNANRKNARESHARSDNFMKATNKSKTSDRTDDVECAQLHCHTAKKCNSSSDCIGKQTNDNSR